MHVESFKRLILLYSFNDNLMKNNISVIIKQNSSLMKIKPLEIYEKYYQLFNGVTNLINYTFLTNININNNINNIFRKKALVKMLMNI